MLELPSEDFRGLLDREVVDPNPLSAFDGEVERVSGSEQLIFTAHFGVFRVNPAPKDVNR